MRKNAKKILAMLLAAIALFATACSGDGTPAETTAAPIDTMPPATSEVTTQAPETTAPSPDLEAIEYNCTINALYNRNDLWPIIDISPQELTGEVLNDALCTRTMRIEEKYKIDLVTTATTLANIHTALQNTVYANDQNIDFALLSLSESMKAAVNGYLMNQRELEHNDYSMPWWNTQIVEETTIGGKSYFTLGAMNLSAYDGTPVTLFNKTYITDYKLEDPYQLVRDGKWTLDKMIEMATGINADLDSNGKMNHLDQWGMASNNFVVDVFLYGCDIKFAEVTPEGTIEFDVNIDKLSGIIEKINRLCSPEYTYLGDRFGSSNEFRETHPNNCFKENRVLFVATLLQNVSNMRANENDFGILPIPKYNEAQENYTSYTHMYNAQAICIPQNYTKTDMISRILEDMNYESWRTCVPIYLETFLRYKGLRDSQSGEMLDLVLDSYTCDLANIIRGSGLALGNDLRALVTNQSNDVASLLAKNNGAYEASVKKVSNAFQ